MKSSKHLRRIFRNPDSAMLDRLGDYQSIDPAHQDEQYEKLEHRLCQTHLFPDSVEQDHRPGWIGSACIAAAVVLIVIGGLGGAHYIRSNEESVLQPIAKHTVVPASVSEKMALYRRSLLLTAEDLYAWEQLSFHYTVFFNGHTFTGDAAFDFTEKCYTVQAERRLSNTAEPCEIYYASYKGNNLLLTEKSDGSFVYSCPNLSVNFIRDDGRTGVGSILEPQYTAQAYLHDMDAWEIVRTTTLYGLNCTVAEGSCPVVDDTVQVAHFEVIIEEQTGIWLGFEGYNAKGELIESIQTADLKIGTEAEHYLQLEQMAEIASEKCGEEEEFKWYEWLLGGSS